jgi:hypothetical protein
MLGSWKAKKLIAHVIQAGKLEGQEAGKLKSKNRDADTHRSKNKLKKSVKIGGNPRPMYIFSFPAFQPPSFPASFEL